MGQNTLESLARACTEPDSLTPNDLLVLDRYYITGVLHVMRELQVERAGGFEGERWKEIGRSIYRQIFMTSLGRRWWEAANKQNWMKEIRELGDQVLKTQALPDCLRVLEKMRPLKED